MYQNQASRMSKDTLVDLTVLRRLQKPWMELANVTRYSPGLRPSVIDISQARKGEIVQVWMMWKCSAMVAVTFCDTCTSYT
jgi:hypothetical protein